MLFPLALAATVIGSFFSFFSTVGVMVVAFHSTRIRWPLLYIRSNVFGSITTALVSVLSYISITARKSYSTFVYWSLVVSAIYDEPYLMLLLTIIAIGVLIEYLFNKTIENAITIREESMPKGLGSVKHEASQNIIYLIAQQGLLGGECNCFRRSYCLYRLGPLPINAGANFFNTTDHKNLLCQY